MAQAHPQMVMAAASGISALMLQVGNSDQTFLKNALLLTSIVTTASGAYNTLTNKPNEGGKKAKKMTPRRPSFDKKRSQKAHSRR